MAKDARNIYRNARIASGMTQERWAEHLGITPDSVRRYESGEMMPADDIVIQMAELSAQHILCYWHLVRKSRIAAVILPELDQLGLPEAVLGLLIQIEDFRDTGMKKLLRIAADGKVDEDEAAEYEEAIRQLTAVVRSAMALGYSK